jgi:hypothetical protein
MKLAKAAALHHKLCHGTPHRRRHVERGFVHRGCARSDEDVANQKHGKAKRNNCGNQQELTHAANFLAVVKAKYTRALLMP